MEYRNFSFLEHLVSLSRLAGQEIMKIYNSPFQVNYKEDQSPLTKADLAANEIICRGLKEILDIPILSEENILIDYNERKKWEHFWIVDPLDGTKEFINRNGEFTVNIALIKKNKPILGVIYVPAADIVYFASEFFGCYKKTKNLKPNLIKNLKNTKKADKLIVVGSRSHESEEFKEFLTKNIDPYKEVEIKKIGSSLKFCLVAEGIADIYPRFGPTKEWDTAAGHIISKMAGKQVVNYNTKKELIYNKKELINPNFLVY